jgi:hypothetical protein
MSTAKANGTSSSESMKRSIAYVRIVLRQFINKSSGKVKRWLGAWYSKFRISLIFSQAYGI